MASSDVITDSELHLLLRGRPQAFVPQTNSTNSLASIRRDTGHTSCDASHPLVQGTKYLGRDCLCLQVERSSLWDKGKQAVLTKSDMGMQWKNTVIGPYRRTREAAVLVLVLETCLAVRTRTV